MMAGARWLTAFQYWVVMVLVVKSAYGLLKALSNGIFSKAAKTWNPGGKKKTQKNSAKSKAYKPIVVDGICNGSKQ